MELTIQLKSRISCFSSLSLQILWDWEYFIGVLCVRFSYLRKRFVCISFSLFVTFVQLGVKNEKKLFHSKKIILNAFLKYHLEFWHSSHKDFLPFYRFKHRGKWFTVKWIWFGFLGKENLFLILNQFCSRLFIKIHKIARCLSLFDA